MSRAPTLRRRRSQVAAGEDGGGNLQQSFRELEQYWNSYEQSKPSSLRRRRSSGSTDSTTAVSTALHLLDNSPRILMSSLQQRRWSPPERWCRVRSNDDAREEIVGDRKAAIQSGKLKGRRLFGEMEGEVEMGSGGFDHLVQESEVRSVSSYGSYDENGDCGRKEEEVTGFCCCCSCSSGSSLSDEEVEREEAFFMGGEEVGRVNVEVKGREDWRGGNGGGRRLLLMVGWFSVALMVFTLRTMYLRCNGVYVDENEVIVVPT
ncbi:hypothetical protein U1Q18_007051 [Sarracenia purpurea var. burkii]